MNHGLSEECYSLSLVVVLEDAKEEGEDLVGLVTHETAALRIKLIVRDGPVRVDKDDQSVLCPFPARYVFRHPERIGQ